MMQLHLQIYSITIVVLMQQNRSINHSFYARIYWNQANQLWVITEILKIAVRLFSYPVKVHSSTTLTSET